MSAGPMSCRGVILCKRLIRNGQVFLFKTSVGGRLALTSVRHFSHQKKSNLQAVSLWLPFCHGEKQCAWQSVRWSSSVDPDSPKGNSGNIEPSSAAKPEISAAPPSAGSTISNEPASEIIVKGRAAATADGRSQSKGRAVKPTSKDRRPKIDLSQTYTANIYIPMSRAMSEYMLESSELDNLQSFLRRSPYPEKEKITVYRRRDLEQRAIAKWGSLENLQLQKDFKKARDYHKRQKYFVLKNEQEEYVREHARSTSEKPFIYSPSTKKAPSPAQTMFQHGSGRVVLYAIFVNAANCGMKFAAWLYTGSHSMFSEFIHSLADTANQLILAAGIRQSLKKPDLEHPYGWANFRNVSSLISGVGIFCVGAGLSFYHGITGLFHPGEVESLFWALAVLGGSFMSEGATLLVAINEVKQSCRLQKMTFSQYVFRGRDPSVNVVLLEDAAAVLGLTIAASCISLSHYTGSSLPDAVGSLLIGSLLGGVASFIIYTNTLALVGKSIPAERKTELMRELESDRMIRTLHDVKATDVGGRYVRFKAEVDFDGKEITRYYLEQQDLEKMLTEMQSLKTIDEGEAFMLKHGENIIDTLGSEVDRIEKNLKNKHPEIRHCDLEQL